MILFVFKTSPKASFTDEETEKLTDRIQNAGTEVVNAKAGSVGIFFVFVFVHLENILLDCIRSTLVVKYSE